MNINQEVWNVIKILMENSFWGSNSSNVSLINDLNNEVDEFIQGFKNNDIINSIEEAADVMMILFCILYKINGAGGEISIDGIMEAIIKKLKRRFQHLYEGKEMEEKQENEIWKCAKQIENLRNYMFCDNLECEYCGKMGADNIKIESQKFFCRGCGRQIKISKKTVLFYNKKNRKKYVQVVINSILEYVQGNSMAPEILKTDNLKIFNSFCNDILNSKYNLREYFINYVCEKFKIHKEEVSKFCNVVLKNYNRIEVDELFEYCVKINEGNYNILQCLTNKEIIKMKNRLSNLTMDVEKRIEKVIEYNAHNWNNQLVHKYLLKYRKDEVDRIIECMTIIHYQDETIRDLTVELSNMYNCVVGCSFCASGALPETTCFLDALDYVRQLNTCLKESGVDPNEFENFYVSFAGIGEPSVVYKTIAEGMVMIRDLYPKVKFNIATFGFNIECFDYWSAFGLPIRTLQIPFYSDKVEMLKYIVKNLPETYSFETIVKKAINYKNKWPDCRVKINYIAMSGINDSDVDIKRMCNCLEQFKEQIVVKISYLNYTKPGEENNIKSSGSERLSEIKKFLDMKQFNCYIFGTDINTELGCGQLAQNHISSND